MVAHGRTAVKVWDGGGGSTKLPVAEKDVRKHAAGAFGEP